ncbi:unnamed protein product [Phyllotreta striolata]|uniref:Peptidase S1 domain-containing protein n=1 Tax=Phyllotreta striolata TaxID=444603 RepID=A0A9N9XLX4_PHYSR|nr:unnamed protein product [Phyllotreta striolata]
MFTGKLSLILLATAVTISAASSVPNLGLEGATVAAKGQFPFQASVQSCPLTLCRHVCGGVIINANWILTASSCLDKADRIVVATVDLDDNLAYFYIKAKVAYKGNANSPDIGLIKLTEPIPFGKNCQPVKLPKQGQEFNGTAVVSGYGHTLIPNNNVLGYVSGRKIVTYEECNKVLVSLAGLEGSSLNPTNNICTLNERSNNCHGDDGGPLSQDGVLVGTVTWHVRPCGKSNAPNVFTKVSNFVDWINQTIASNK